MRNRRGAASHEDVRHHFLTMTPGRLMGLRRVSDAEGRFKVLACDQNSSFRRMIAEHRGRAPEPNELVDAKLDIVAGLGDYASAVLLDVNYGARQALNSGALPRDPALLIRVEASKPAGAPAEVEPGWGVEQIKRFGADGVKLLVYLDTEDEAGTRVQLELVRRIHRECRAQDILLLIEELSFPREASGEQKSSASYLERQPGNVLASVGALGPLCDVLKVEFPGDLLGAGKHRCLQYLGQLNETAIRPWVLLSAGVDFDDFLARVKLAMKSGASGIMAGRAIFKEYFVSDTREERVAFLTDVAVDRWRRLCDVVDDYATPWQQWAGVTSEDLAAQVSPDWYLSAGSAGPAC